ncbi:MAG: hypothetical protein J5746_12210 [Victivallales bacterium]|nr:hypothetical protein [Victivallales bacterium]
MTVNCDMQGSLLDTLARMKKIPIGKVIRNAGRDFAREAYKITPTAQISKSPYYRYFDQRDQKWHYLHESQVVESYTTKRGLTRNRIRQGAKDAFGKLKKVKIAKGWSKASWIGVFKALGLPPKAKGSLPVAVEQLSDATMTETAWMAEIVIADDIRFNHFGNGADGGTADRIAKAGYDAAARNINKEIDRLMKRRWEGGK